MKKNSSILTSLACIAGLALTTAATSLANVLTNPGFETDAVLNAPPVATVTGWTDLDNAFTASTTVDPVRTGTGSLQLNSPGGSFSVPEARQTFPASPGETWTFEGYMLATNTLPADATFGVLKIVWVNASNGEIPPGTALIGTANNGANPGIESAPLLNSASATNTWVFTQARGVAPAGTVSVKLLALLVDQSAGTIYMDDLQATNLPYVGPPIINYPTNNAPTPTRPPASVKSMYNSSGTYTDVTIDTWYTGWSGNPAGNGDYGITNPPSPTVTSTVKKYLGMAFAGVDFASAPIDTTGYNTLHVDVWTPNANQFGIQLVSLDPNTQAAQVNFLPASGTITTNNWISLDIPLSQFASANPNTDLTNLKQLLWLDNQAGGGVVNGDFYIDNVYFYSNAVVPPPVVNYPTNAAPTPARPASSVVSLYNSSGVYTDVNVDTWLTGWSAASYSTFTITNGSNPVVKRYSSLNYAGVQFENPKVDATGMTTFHVDLWTPNASKFSVKLVSSPGGEYEVVFTNNIITTNNWISLDIPLSTFTNGQPNIQLANLNLVLFINNNPGGPEFGTFYIDNVYFWSTNQVEASIALGSQVSWPASSGNTYQPQESANGTIWANLGGPLSGNTVTNRFDATPAPFYQVEEVTSGAVNGVLNGGFETSAVNPPYAANWLAAGSGGAIAEPVRTTTTAPYAGTYALEIEGQGNGVGAGPVALQNDIPAAPGAVTLSFQAKGALMLGGANPQYGIFWFDASNTLLGGGFASIPGGLSGSYQLKTINLTAPANTDHAQVQFLLAVGAGAGDHWTMVLDEVSLASAGAPTTNILSAAVQPAAGISWSSEAGRTYTVQSSPSLAPLNWSPLGANVLGTGTNTVSDPVNSTNKFYRVLEVY